jgi:hypothetical protein
VLRVEDWAEIRRPHRAEAMPIKAIASARRLEEHGEGGDLIERAAEIPASFSRIDR